MKDEYKLHCPDCENGMCEYTDGYMCNTAGDACGFSVMKLGYPDARPQCPMCFARMYTIEKGHACPKCRHRSIRK